MRSILLLLLLLTLSSEAQTIAGGEIYYDLIGNKKYLVTAVVYRKCETSALTYLDGFVISDTVKIAMSLKRHSISLLEKGCGNPCDIQNAKSNAGYEKHIFTDTVDLTLQKYSNILQYGNCKVKFAIHQDIRNYKTTNLDNNIMFYLDAEVNYCFNSKNVHSPKFSFDPKFKALKNQTVLYNPGTLDTIDLDELNFEMVTPLSDVNSAINYNNSFNYSLPLSPYCPPNPGMINCRPIPNSDPPRGFYFDKTTGTIALSPNNVGELSVIKIKVIEKRKDSTGKLVVLGYVTREMEIEVIYNTKYTPILKTVPELTVCLESQNIKIIKAYNGYSNIQNTDTIQYAWNHGIPGGHGYSNISMTDTNPNFRELVFEVNPKLTQKDYTFYVGYQAYINSCLENIHSNALVVKVNKEINTIRTIIPLSCSQYQYKIFPIDSSLFYDYKINLYKLGSGQIIQSSNLKSYLFNVPGNGSYVFENIINLKGSTCKFYQYDTIIAGSSQFNILKSYKNLGCLGDSFTLSAPIKDFENLNLIWKDLASGQTSSDKQFTGIVDRNSTQIELQMNGNPFCKNKDTLIVHPKGKFFFEGGNGPKNVCIFDQKLVSAKTLDAHYPLLYNWSINQTPLNYSDSNLNVMIDANKLIKLTVTDDLGCNYSDSINFTAIEYPKFSIENQKVCKGNTAIISVKQGDTQTLVKTEWFVDGISSGKSGLSYNMIVNKNSLIKLKAGNGTGCSSEANATLTKLDLPIVNIISETNFNYHNRIIMSIDKTMKKYEWSNGDSTQQTDFWAHELGNPGQYYLNCKVTDSNSCSASVNKIIYTDQFTSTEDAKNNGIGLYPNPAEDMLLINGIIEGEYIIFNNEGKLVLKGTTNGSIDIEGLTQGLYILHLQGQTYKFMKVSQ